MSSRKQPKPANWRPPDLVDEPDWDSLRPLFEASNAERLTATSSVALSLCATTVRLACRHWAKFEKQGQPPVAAWGRAMDTARALMKAAIGADERESDVVLREALNRLEQQADQRTRARGLVS